MMKILMLRPPPSFPQNVHPKLLHPHIIFTADNAVFAKDKQIRKGSIMLPLPQILTIAIAVGTALKQTLDE